MVWAGLLASRQSTSVESFVPVTPEKGLNTVPLGEIIIMKHAVIYIAIMISSFYAEAQINPSFYISCGTYMEFDSIIFNKLSIKVRGADTFRLQPNTLLLVPFDSVVDLQIKYKDSIMVNSKYKVLIPPLPEFKIVSDKEDITKAKVIPLNHKLISVLARPNPEFVKIKEYDCRYRVFQPEFIVKRNGETICVDKWNENDWERPINCDLKQNDNLTIKISAFERTNFRNEKIITQVNKSFKYIIK